MDPGTRRGKAKWLTEKKEIVVKIWMFILGAGAGESCMTVYEGNYFQQRKKFIF
jgi:hypothetical protein